MKFEEDLEFGQEAEAEFAEILTDAGFKVIQSKGNVPEYDLIATNEFAKYTYEIKTDRKESMTHKVAVEVGKVLQTGQEKAGVFTSRADYWVYKIAWDKNFYVIKTEDLKQLVEGKLGEIVMGGDKERMQLVLIDKKEFSDKCICKYPRKTFKEASVIDRIRQKLK